MNKKSCNKCNKVKKLIHFFKDKSSKDGFKKSCKPCFNGPRKEALREQNRLLAIYLKEDKKDILRRKMERKKARKEQREALINQKRVKKSCSNKKCGECRECHSNYKYNLLATKRRKIKELATPKSLTENQLIEIENFYIKAKELTKSTGISHVVDHILPLQGNNITGLHVPWNLQILTRRMNAIKSKKFDFTYDNEGWKA